VDFLRNSAIMFKAECEHDYGNARLATIFFLHLRFGG